MLSKKRVWFILFAKYLVFRSAFLPPTSVRRQLIIKRRKRLVSTAFSCRFIFGNRQSSHYIANKIALDSGYCKYSLGCLDRELEMLFLTGPSTSWRSKHSYIYASYLSGRYLCRYKKKFVCIRLWSFLVSYSD